MGDAPSAWSGQLLSPTTVGQDNNVVNSGNGSDLNFNSQPSMDASGPSLSLAPWYHFGNRDNQVQPQISGQEANVGVKGQHNEGIGESSIDLVPDEVRDLAELLLDNSDDVDIHGGTISSATWYHFGNRDNQVQPQIYGQEANVGVKDQHNEGIGESTDLVPDEVRDVAELLLDSSDDVDMSKDDDRWWLQLPPGGE